MKPGIGPSPKEGEREEAIEITSEYRELFTVEAREHLDEWESALLLLESTPGDEELVNQIFRAIHTLKGSAGFIGFEALQQLAHELESTLQHVRDGEEELAEGQTELLFSGLDSSKKMVEAFAAGRDWNEDLLKFPGRFTQSQTQPRPAAKETAIRHRAPRTLRMEVLIDSSEREASLRAFLLRSRLSAVATIIREEPAPEDLTDSGGRLRYAIVLSADAGEDDIRAAANIDQVEILSVSSVPPVGDRRSGGDDPTTHASGAERASSELRPERPVRRDEVVRVSVDRLDNLLNLVGELVVQNSNFVSLSEELRNVYGRNDAVVRLAEKSEGLAKITRDLQDGIMKVRMLPINSVFMRFHRVVRDLSHTSGKEVALEIFGGETEIDKKVIDRIGDPLVHLVRNAVDHGLESRDKRLASGKPPVGSLRLGAYQDGDHICVEVSDDGGGLDTAAILDTARGKGIITETERNLTDEQVIELIFRPGFSTAKRITDVSGRGVGMDAVKQTIEALGGTLRIRSLAGRGTTVTITLPLTMAIIRAVLVDVDGIYIAVPLSAVKEILSVTESALQTVGGGSVIRLREEVLTVVHLREVLELEHAAVDRADHEKEPVVVVEFENCKVGLGVNRIIGTQEIVIKSLSRHYREVEGFVGASILGDGSIALIVDAEAIVRRFYQPDASPLAPGALRTTTQTEGSKNAGEGGPEVVSETETAPEPVEAVKIAVDEAPAAAAMPNSRLAAELLDAVGSSGALRASVALSQMTGAEVRVGFPDSMMVKVAGVAELLGGDEAEVLGIYVGIVGELSGGILIVVPPEHLATINGLLLGSDDDGTADISVIQEFGNLLSASFINAMADEAGLSMQSEAPELAQDMCLPVIDSVVARFNSPGDETFLTKAVVFFGDDEEIGCSLLLFLEPESLNRLLAVPVSGSR